MQILEAIVVGLPIAGSVHAESCSVLSFADLPFNPLRLILLIGWVYLCMYFVQRAHFSPLVPQGYKTIANVVTLFTGPFLLLTLFLIDTARKTHESRESFFDILKRQLQLAVTIGSLVSTRGRGGQRGAPPAGFFGSQHGRDLRPRRRQTAWTPRSST